MLRLPFSILPVNILEKISPLLKGISEKISKLFPFLDLNLKQASIKIAAEEYVRLCLTSTSFFFLFISIVFGLVLYKSKYNPIVIIPVALVLSIFVFIQQIAYPKLLANRKIKGIEGNLLAALQSMLVQLKSGVPLFDILVNLSYSNYGELTKEIKKVVREINAGVPQIEALEIVSAENPSLYFRRAIWQLVNGMKTGADMSNVIKEVISDLSEQQIIQIQNYGGALSPLAMFYMVIAIIMPSLGITFIIVLSSFISFSEFYMKATFWGLYAFTVFFQFMFLGIIKSKRPNLLG